MVPPKRFCVNDVAVAKAGKSVLVGIVNLCAYVHSVVNAVQRCRINGQLGTCT